MIDFVYVSVLYPVTLLNSPTNYRRGVCVWVGVCIPQDFLHRQLCYLKVGAVVYLSFQSVCLLYYFLALLHRLGLPVLC